MVPGPQVCPAPLSTRQFHPCQAIPSAIRGQSTSKKAGWFECSAKPSTVGEWGQPNSPLPPGEGARRAGEGMRPSSRESATYPRSQGHCRPPPRSRVSEVQREPRGMLSNHLVARSRPIVIRSPSRGLSRTAVLIFPFVGPHPQGRDRLVPPAFRDRRGLGRRSPAGSSCRPGLPRPLFPDLDMLGSQPQLDPPRRPIPDRGDPPRKRRDRPTRLGRDPLDPDPYPLCFAGDLACQEIHGRAADEFGHETAVRVVIDFPGRPLLDDAAPLRDRHLFSDCRRFILVMGDVEGRGLESTMEPHQIRARAEARSGVSRPERGSSNRNIRGCRTIARPRATRCR